MEKLLAKAISKRYRTFEFLERYAKFVRSLPGTKAEETEVIAGIETIAVGSQDKTYASLCSPKGVACFVN
jgi:hypothetical protein